MTYQEYLEFAEIVRKNSERVMTREEARKQLFKEGFITEDGELSPNYR